MQGRRAGAGAAELYAGLESPDKAGPVESARPTDLALSGADFGGEVEVLNLDLPAQPLQVGAEAAAADALEHDLRARLHACGAQGGCGDEALGGSRSESKTTELWDGEVNQEERGGDCSPCLGWPRAMGAPMTASLPTFSIYFEKERGPRLSKQVDHKAGSGRGPAAGCSPDSPREESFGSLQRNKVVDMEKNKSDRLLHRNKKISIAAAAGGGASTDGHI